MHGEKTNELSKNHWTHHEHTLDNMNLKKSKQYNFNKNKYLGLYFVWKYTIIVFIVGLIEAFLLYYLLYYFTNIRISRLSIIIWVLFFAIFQSSFWNTIHPDIHNTSLNLNWSEGIPGWNGWKILFSNIYINNNKRLSLYDWLKQNHKLHHLRKGERKGNYNVTLPGADYIMGKMYNSI
jgi:hypothetical protein